MDGMFTLAHMSYNITGNYALALEQHGLVMLGQFRDNAPDKGPEFVPQTDAIAMQLNLAYQMVEGYRTLAPEAIAEVEMTLPAQSEVVLRDD